MSVDGSPGAHEGQTETAEAFATRLLAAADTAGSREGVEAVSVSTQEICRAMGKPAGATMEEVKSYSCDVAQCLQGHGVTVACGCGYLSLLVFTDDAMATACEENRELRIAPLESLAP